MKTIEQWAGGGVVGAKRAYLVPDDYLPDWFWGHGKHEDCKFEGTWWDMICFARNVLAHPNTEMAAPEFYKPEWKNDNYIGEEQPYVFTGGADEDGSSQDCE